jgi:hypothetical protein
VKKNISLKLALVIIGIFIIVTGYFVQRNFVLTQKELNNLVQGEISIQENTLSKIREKRVAYIINKGNGIIDSFKISPSQNSTVFSLLEELSQRESFKIEFTFYQGMGVLVKSIDGVENGTDNKYWQYWVNGELPMVAADKKEVKAGDRIEWKFESSPF